MRPPHNGAAVDLVRRVETERKRRPVNPRKLIAALRALKRLEIGVRDGSR